MSLDGKMQSSCQFSLFLYIHLDLFCVLIGHCGTGRSLYMLSMFHTSVLTRLLLYLIK